MTNATETDAGAQASPAVLATIVAHLHEIGVHVDRMDEDGWWIHRGRDGHELFVYLTEAEAQAFAALPEKDEAGYQGWGTSAAEAYFSVRLVNVEEELTCGEGLPRFLVFDDGDLIIAGKPDRVLPADLEPGEYGWFAFPP
ncbi:hypothetical protein [Actinoplanes sp. NPDC051851]|uniref:hypothetical protein n=1 Tax=Actinoplanes sp. NPDC051851 TaxID=3154753 RepID=UPI00344818ED